MTKTMAEFIENKVLDAFIKEGRTDFEINSNRYTIMVYNGSGVHVWCDGGNTVICTIDSADLKDYRKRAVNKVLKAILEAADGRVHCCECNKVIRKAEAGGHFYAGIYCKDCWNKTYKAKAESENYD